MKRAILRIAVAAMLIVGSTAVAARAQSGFEPSPLLWAKDLAAPELLRGPQFVVNERVPVKDFLCRFTLRSDYGTFDVHGLRMLYIRVHEVHGLALLNQMSNTQEFLQAAAQAVARPVTSAVNMITNPVETVEGLPGGVTRLFDRIKLGGEEIAAAATAPSGTDEQKVASVTQRVGSITVDVLGFEKERRQLAKSVGVDPYTTNPVLGKKLTDMAWVAFSGRVAIEATMSVVVPGSTIMSAVSFTNSTVYDTPPGDLVNNAQAIFASTGASPAQVQGLIRNPQYSLTILTAVAQGVQRLQGVPGIAAVVPFAAAAKTQDETNFVASAINMLARYHESTQRIALVTAPGPILGRTVSGELVVAAPVDYVAWTEPAARFARREDLRAPQRLIWLSGELSPRARKGAEALGWKTYESFTIAAER